MLARLEQLAGLALIVTVLADVFLNVLYARAGIAIISRPLAHGVRAVFVGVGRLFPTHRPRILSFCGPAIVVALLFTWVAGLTIGSAMVLQPALGTALRTFGEPIGHGFATALYVAAGLISSAGAGGLSPHTTAYNLFFAFDSFLGISVMTLAITYLMQLYAALQARDELALKVELMTGQTGDAARLVAGLGPDGRFETGYAILAEIAAELSRVKEAHHLYPVLFYFRFPQALYELSRFTLVLLDAVALIRAGLEPRAAGWLQRSAGLEHLERGGLVLIETLHRVYLRDEGEGPEEPAPEEVAAWRRRFGRGLAVLREAGCPVRRDLARAGDAYVRLRNQWNDPLLRLGGAIGHEPAEIDAALHDPQPLRDKPEPTAPLIH
ncbi:two pore domain potassium channel family protein [Phenylobacterium soli]|nr:two pore domain potassium channel family protein [Phenylobacterium soli]